MNRSYRWLIALLVVLFGITLSAPVASAHSGQSAPSHAHDRHPNRYAPLTPVRPQSSLDGIVVVGCDLNTRDPQLVAQALAAKNPALLKRIAVGCHIPADGRMTKCDLVPSDESVIYNMKRMTQACFIHRPRIRFVIYDELGRFQSEEWAHVSLDDNPIEAMYIDKTEPAEMLLIGVPEAGSYSYTLAVESHYDRGGCPRELKRSIRKTINVRDGSFFVGREKSCHSDEIWLEDQTAFPN